MDDLQIPTIEIKRVTRSRNNFKNNQKNIEVPAWISGDVKNLDEVEEFVSEDESTERIIIILLIFSTFLLFIATCFTVICKKLSNSSSAKKEWINPDTGKLCQNYSALKKNLVFSIFEEK